MDAGVCIGQYRGLYIQLLQKLKPPSGTRRRLPGNSVHTFYNFKHMEEKKGVKWWIALVIAVLSAIAGAFGHASL